MCSAMCYLFSAQTAGIIFTGIILCSFAVFVYRSYTFIHLLYTFGHILVILREYL